MAKDDATARLLEEAFARIERLERAVFHVRGSKPPSPFVAAKAILDVAKKGEK